MTKFTNRYNLPCVDAYLRLYGALLTEKFDELRFSNIPLEAINNSCKNAGERTLHTGRQKTTSSLPEVIEFLPLPDDENDYNDVIVKVANCIYISESQVGKMGFSNPELFAALSHELGHILYRTHPWTYDSEERADTLAAELGLGSQMISVIEKIIASRRFRYLTGALVQRIQFLQHLESVS